MSIDWSKAPEWADKHGYAAYDGIPVWLNDVKYSYVDGRQDHREFSFSACEGWTWSQISGITIRPTPWTGAGIPPVGTVCEIELIDKEWVQVVVVAVTDYRIYCEETSHHECVDGPTEWCPVKAHANFRPIRTPEQIAAEKRIEEINEMAELSLYGHYAFTLAQAKIACAVLHDKGYRKVTP